MSFFYSLSLLLLLFIVCSPFLYVECTVGVPGNISASAAHRLAELARNEMMTRFVCIDTVIVFVHPFVRLSVSPWIRLPDSLCRLLSVYLSIFIRFTTNVFVTVRVCEYACVCLSVHPFLDRKCLVILRNQCFQQCPCILSPSLSETLPFL